MIPAEIPTNRQGASTKPEIAIQEINRVSAAGARFGWVLADAGHDYSEVFRHALSERRPPWAFRLSRRQNLHPPQLNLILAVAKIFAALLARD
ncbi:SRSO17 transposase [Methylobacterium brachythecii]|uniref:SRSO17 transposase n=2 Tax=Methylobacterium brachythecii TaxID=1176177 RepID=A0A7W6AHZ4_9HYPH|nr:SRSO17 transposase [Methylobacterium brachythecii]